MLAALASFDYGNARPNAVFHASSDKRPVPPESVDRARRSGPSALRPNIGDLGSAHASPKPAIGSNLGQIPQGGSIDPNEYGTTGFRLYVFKVGRAMSQEFEQAEAGGQMTLTFHAVRDRLNTYKLIPAFSSP